MAESEIILSPNMILLLSKIVNGDKTEMRKWIDLGSNED